MSRYTARALIICMSITGLSVLSGCGGGHPFEFLDASYAPKGTTVAVVSGSADDATERFAQHLTASLEEKSTLKVLSQKQVAQRLGKYPVNIKTGDPQNNNWDKPVWYSSRDKAHIASIARAVNADYALFMWVDSINRITTTSSRGGSSVSYQAIIIGNMVDRKGNAAGFSNFGSSKGQTCCLFGVSEGQDVNSLLQIAAGEVAREFAQRTGTAKP
jgi:hypothetical protein